MRRLFCALLSLTALGAVSVAHAEHSLALPKLLSHEPAMPLSVLGFGFFAPHAILDLRSVQQDPVMRARREYALMAALPTTERAPGGALPTVLTETQTWKVSRNILFTFPLAITGRNLVTAEIAGAGRVGLAPEGMAKGGVFTFAGAF